ncbi:MAG: hypothetical protein GXX83_02970 [Gaiellales bacterium]|nr:hypothetical protein [Gaiellales bacterium]
MPRLLGWRATGRGAVRRGTALESGFIEGTVPEGTRAFDAWAYRVTARLAGRVHVVVYPDSVVVTEELIRLGKAFEVACAPAATHAWPQRPDCALYFMRRRPRHVQLVHGGMAVP